jgi:hypothetical protein
MYVDIYLNEKLKKKKRRRRRDRWPRGECQGHTEWQNGDLPWLAGAVVIKYRGLAVWLRLKTGSPRSWVSMAGSWGGRTLPGLQTTPLYFPLSTVSSDKGTSSILRAPSS